MEDGVYILITKDGYRVTYSEDNYIYLYGSFNDGLRFKSGCTK